MNHKFLKTYYHAFFDLQLGPKQRRSALFHMDRPAFLAVNNSYV